MEERRAGILLDEEALKLQRQYFEEAVRLIGIYVIYRAIKPDAQGKPRVAFTSYQEMLANYQEPELVGCLFHEHPDQKTLKKIGWVSELQKEACLIQVPYNLHDLQKGCLFIIPSGIDNSKGRLFRVESMSVSMLCPPFVTCELVPEFDDIFQTEKHDHTTTDFNLLSEEEDADK